MSGMAEERSGSESYGSPGILTECTHTADTLKGAREKTIQEVRVIAFISSIYYCNNGKGTD